MGVGEALELPDFNSGKAVWVLRAGVGFNGVAGSAKETQDAIWDNGKWDGNFKSATGYVVSIGFNKSFGTHPLYWGMGLDLAMRGYKTSAEWSKSGTSQVSGGSDYHKKTEEMTLSTYNVQFSPFTIGYKYTFLERMAADVHLGAYASYDFAGDFKTHMTDHIVSTSKYGNRNDLFPVAIGLCILNIDKCFDKSADSSYDCCTGYYGKPLYLVQWLLSAGFNPPA